MEPKSITVSFLFGAELVQIAADVFGNIRHQPTFQQPKFQRDWNNRVILDAFYKLRETPEWLEFLAKAQIIPPRMLPGFDQGE